MTGAPFAVGTLVAMAKNKPPEPSLDDLTYERAVEQLEQIIAAVESGGVGLEASLTQTEQGMKLIQHCRAILDRAEQRIAELSVDDDGELQPKQ